MPAAARVVMLDLLSIVPYYTGHLCACLQREPGIQVTLASINYHLDPDFFRSQGVQPIPGFLNIGWRIRTGFVFIRRAIKLVEYFVNMLAWTIRLALSRADIIHVQFLPLASHRLPVERWFLQTLKAAGMKIVYTVHNIAPHDGGEHGGREYQHLYQLADKLICHDRLVAARMCAAFAITPAKVAVIPHGPLFDGAGKKDCAGAKARLAIAADDCLILWQGILRPYKGVSFLLDAWRRVCDVCPKATLAIVGTGDEAQKRAIQKQVHALALDSRVRLELRFVTLAELHDFMDAADVFVYPYREITSSGALMTGIAQGKAVVASNLPAFAEILRHGDTAMLVPYGNVPVLSDCLATLITTPDLRSALATRLHVSQREIPRWPELARLTAECYRSVLVEQPAWSSKTIPA